jgi:hypothetical protein
VSIEGIFSLFWKIANDLLSFNIIDKNSFKSNVSENSKISNLLKRSNSLTPLTISSLP